MSGSFHDRMPEARELWETIDRLFELHRYKRELSATWFATEGMKLLSFDPTDNRPVYWGCHLALREIARAKFRGHWDPVEVIRQAIEDDLFPETLQERYPLRAKKGEERVYVLLEHLPDADLAYNVERLRRTGRAYLKHSDALEAWGKQRVRRPEPVA
ncbi:MAG TPA: hypothetical protein VK741_23730 [Acetobacteraceae bacterium]|nr:hypothetical protein [Acetobacteraceae bacterium]